jgi:hypothetical protein
MDMAAGKSFSGICGNNTGLNPAQEQDGSSPSPRGAAVAGPRKQCQ